MQATIRSPVSRVTDSRHGPCSIAEVIPLVLSRYGLQNELSLHERTQRERVADSSRLFPVERVRSGCTVVMLCSTDVVTGSS